MPAWQTGKSWKEGNVTDTPRETRVLDAVVSLVEP